jgi:outer membrane protein assembly factor BamB
VLRGGEIHALMLRLRAARRVLLALAAAGVLLLAPAVCACATEPDTAVQRGEDWPRWRGPRGDGTWMGPRLAPSWPKGGLSVRWRQPLGGGYAGVTVAGDNVILADRQTSPAEVERVICRDAASGALRWTHFDPVVYGKLDYGNGPRAAATVQDGRVYTQGATGRINCLELSTGAVVWTVDLVADFQGRIPTWGYAASPVIVGPTVIVHPGSAKGASIVALDRDTGKKVWASLSDESTYATPMLIERGGRAQIVCWTPSHIRGVDAASGEPLWNIPYEILYGVSIAMPVYHRETIFVSGYWAGSKAIRLDATGRRAKLAWEENRYLRGLMSQPLCRDGYGYLLDKGYGLTCFEMATGRKVWDDKHKVTPRGRNPQATLVWTGDQDRALILNAEGELILARLNPQGYSEAARSKIIGETWAHPAYAGRQVFARDDHEVVCCDLPLAAPEGGQ